MFNVADFLKIADNVYGSIAEQEVCGDVKRWIDTGSYTFNAIVSGSIFKGLPDNKVVCLAGVESTGKCARGTQSIEVYFKTLKDLENFLED